MFFFSMVKQHLPVLAARDNIPYIIDPGESEPTPTQLRLFDRELSEIEMLDLLEAFETLSNYRNYHPSIEAAILCLTGQAVMYGIDVGNIATNINMDITAMSCNFDYRPMTNGLLAHQEW